MTAYDTWAQQVRANGGVITNWPSGASGFTDADTYAAWGIVVPPNAPAARYTASGYAAAANAGGIDLSLPQTQATTGYVYVLAPSNVIQVAQGFMQFDPTKDPNVMPDWYTEYFSWLGPVRKIALVGAGIVGIVLVSNLIRRR